MVLAVVHMKLEHDTLDVTESLRMDEFRSFPRDPHSYFSEFGRSMPGGARARKKVSKIVQFLRPLFLFRNFLDHEAGRIGHIQEHFFRGP